MKTIFKMSFNELRLRCPSGLRPEFFGPVCHPAAVRIVGFCPAMFDFVCVRGSTKHFFPPVAAAQPPAGARRFSICLVFVLLVRFASENFSCPVWGSGDAIFCLGESLQSPKIYFCSGEVVWSPPAPPFKMVGVGPPVQSGRSRPSDPTSGSADFIIIGFIVCAHVYTWIRQSVNI